MRGGVGIRVDPAALLAAARRKNDHPAAPADWLKLPDLKRPLGDGPVGRYGGYLGFTPLEDGGAMGVRIDRLEGGRTREEGIYIPAHGGQVVLFGVSGETIAAKGPCPCPEAAELARLKAEVARLEAAAPAPSPPCPPATALAPTKSTPPQPAPAPQPAPVHPGTGASSVSIPLGHTNIGDRDIDHPWWDLIRLHARGNQIWVTNGTDEWLADHPEVPPDGVNWVRDNLGAIPTGGIDFGNLGDFTIQDKLAHLCEPPPSLEDLKKFKTFDQGFSVSKSTLSQSVVSQFSGHDAAKRPKVEESSLSVTLMANCHWSYDEKTGEVRHETLVNLYVQWMNKDGSVHEVVQTAHDPQVSWFVK